MNTDLIDNIVGLQPGQSLHALRHQRAKVVAATQASYNALFAADLPGISLPHRLLVALYACRLSRASKLAAHYLAQIKALDLTALGVDAALVQSVDAGQIKHITDPQLLAALTFTRTLIDNPIEGDKAALHELTAAGLSTPAVVALAQLIAFLSYQLRVVAGLEAMQAAGVAV
jgi:CMD domain protein